MKCSSTNKSNIKLAGIQTAQRRTSIRKLLLLDTCRSAVSRVYNAVASLGFGSALSNSAGALAGCSGLAAADHAALLWARFELGQEFQYESSRYHRRAAVRSGKL